MPLGSIMVQCNATGTVTGIVCVAGARRGMEKGNRARGLRKNVADSILFVK